MEGRTVEYLLGRLEALIESRNEGEQRLLERLEKLERRMNQHAAEIVQNLTANSHRDAQIEAKVDQLVAMHKHNHQKQRWPRIALFGGGGSVLGAIAYLIERWTS